MNLGTVTRDDWTVGGLALVLAIFLLVLPWFDMSLGPFSSTLTATDGPDAWLGILAVIAALLVVADLAIERLSPHTQIPALGDSRTNTRFALAVATAGFVALKFLFHIHFSGIVSFAWGFYVNVIITAALVYVTHQARAGTAIAWGGLGGMPGGSRVPPPPRRRPAVPPSEPAGPPPRRRAAVPPGEPAGPPPRGASGAQGTRRRSRSTPPPGS